MKKILATALALVIALFAVPVSADTAEDGGSHAKQIFSDYFKEIYGSDAYMYYEELGDVSGYTYVYGAYAEATDTFYTAVLGDYVFNKFYIATPYRLGLYIITENTVYTLETAYGRGIITDEDLPTIASLTQRVSVHKMDAKEKLVYKYLKNNDLFISSNYGYSYVGSIGAYSVVTAKTNVYDYSEEIGKYQVSSETNPWLFATGTQVFIVGDIELEENIVWSLKDACDEGVVNIDYVARLCENNYVSGIHFGLYEPTTEPVTSITEPEPTEPPIAATEATEPTAEQPQTLEGQIKAAVMSRYNTGSPDEITIDYLKKLKNGTALFHYKDKASESDCMVHKDWIGKYIYTYNQGADAKMLFDGKSVYSLREAYQKGVINNTALKEISSYIKTMKEYKITLEAGEQSYVENDFVKKFTVSNSKVLKLDKSDGTITGLTKGTVTVAAKMRNGSKSCTCKVKVTTDPTLTRNSNTVKKLTVRKGMTVKLRIEGKAKGVDNKYTSTKYAKIIAKKTDAVIAVKGIKKGTTNLKVTVNGKKLNLKVVVK